MQNILVIGGTKGIGLEVIRKLDGYNVFFTGRGESFENDGKYTYISMDITKPLPDISNLPEVIHGLVYCPGSINLKPFPRLSEDDFKNDWEVNFFGAVKIIQAVLPRLKMAETASIVLFSTVAVSMGMPYHASVASSKAALEGLTKSLAAEYAPKIKINCIAPSLTLTPLSEKLTNSPEKIDGAAQRHPLKRIGKAEEIAELVCFLLSEKASWMTGQILHMDGGMSSIKL